MLRISLTRPRTEAIFGRERLSSEGVMETFLGACFTLMLMVVGLASPFAGVAIDFLAKRRVDGGLHAA